MNMNLNLDLKNIKFNPAALLGWLNRARPLLIGAVLVGVFGYTALVVNSALNVTPAVVATPATGVSFDKATLNSLNSLTNVPSTVAPTSLGKTDPFGTN